MVTTHTQGSSVARLGLLMAALLLTLACAGLTSFIPTRSSSEAQAAGLDAYAKGDYEQAVTDLTDAVTIDPKLVEAFYTRGEVYYLLGQYDLAVADYSHALNLGYEPAAQLYSARSAAYDALGDYDLGLDDYYEAYRQDAEFVDTYYPDRVEAFTQAITLRPELASAYFARGLAETTLQDSAAAVADFTTAIELKQEPLRGVYFWRGAAQSGLQDYAAAVDDFTQALAAGPATAALYDARAHAYAGQTKYELALADFDAALEIEPDDARVHNNRCWLGSLIGRAEAVMPSCERAVALAPNVPAYRDSRGLGRALTGDYAGAIEDFQAYLDFVKARGGEDETRAYWVSELQAGRNPFDAETLQALLGP